MNVSYKSQRSFNRIGGVMVSVLASSAVDRGFETRLGVTHSLNDQSVILSKK